MDVLMSCSRPERILLVRGHFGVFGLAATVAEVLYISKQLLRLIVLLAFVIETVLHRFSLES